MRRWKPIFAALLFTLPALHSYAVDPPPPFDGKWLTTVSCEPSRGALGFSYQFPGTVTNSVFHGLHGTLDKPGYLQVDGPIQPDGKASLYAKGRTGSKEYVPGRDTPSGTEFGYNIDAHFDPSSGTGTRVEGRPCTLKFVRQ